MSITDCFHSFSKVNTISRIDYSNRTIAVQLTFIHLLSLSFTPSVGFSVTCSAQYSHQCINVHNIAISTNLKRKYLLLSLSLLSEIVANKMPHLTHRQENFRSSLSFLFIAQVATNNGINSLLEQQYLPTLKPLSLLSI